jgi:hypothetical protein
MSNLCLSHKASKKIRVSHWETVNQVDHGKSEKRQYLPVLTSKMTIKKGTTDSHQSCVRSAPAQP